MASLIVYQLSRNDLEAMLQKALDLAAGAWPAGASAPEGFRWQPLVKVTEKQADGGNLHLAITWAAIATNVSP